MKPIVKYNFQLSIATIAIISGLGLFINVIRNIVFNIDFIPIRTGLNIFAVFIVLAIVIVGAQWISLICWKK